MGVIPEDLSPPPGPDHDQPGRLSFRGLWVCGICRHSFSRSSGHSEALTSERITSVSANLCCPCLLRRRQSHNHGQRLRDGNQVLPVPAQPALLREYFTFDAVGPGVFVHARVRLGLSERCLLTAGGARSPHQHVLCVFLQLCGAVIMGFGLWLLLDNQSFIVVLRKLYI